MGATRQRQELVKLREESEAIDDIFVTWERKQAVYWSSDRGICMLC